MAPSSSSTKVSLKLLIDTKNQRVIFAEADKTAVDFLFHLLTLPLGTIVRLLSNKNMVGSLGNLYDSVQNLSETYIQPGQTKDALLKPVVSVPGGGGAAVSSPLFSLPDINRPTPTAKASYKCSYCSAGYCTDDPSASCPSCHRTMSSRMTYVSPPGAKGKTGDGAAGESEGGFVKGMVTYMVMDDLVVKPMSAISGIALLNKYNVTEIGSVEEKEVDLGIDEALDLLKMSMASKTVLTSVFLKNVKKC